MLDMVHLLLPIALSNPQCSHLVCSCLVDVQEEKGHKIVQAEQDVVLFNHIAPGKHDVGSVAWIADALK